MDPLMSLSGISKSFAGNKVLKQVSFDLRAGEVHALLGENGAGKSTLIKIIAGVYVPDEGSIHVGGHEMAAMTPKLAREKRHCRGVPGTVAVSRVDGCRKHFPWSAAAQVLGWH